MSRSRPWRQRRSLAEFLRSYRQGFGQPNSPFCRFESLEDRRLLSITVNTLVDQNDGAGVGGISLRDAIAAASPGTVIDFSVTGRITLTKGELAIGKNLTIVGPGANLLTIDASGNDPTPGTDIADGSRVFEILVGAAVQISNLTITGGDAVSGGGVYNSGDLTLVGTIITDNAAITGGGIYSNSAGTLTITDCTVNKNSAPSGVGGGIYSSSSFGGTSISGSKISENTASGSGGGLYFNGVTGAFLSVVNTEIKSNQSTGTAGFGGGVELVARSGSSAALQSVLIEANTSQNIGGGIATLVDTGSSILIMDSTITGNQTARFGGGAYLSTTNGSTYVINSTVSENRAGLDGGGINLTTGTLGQPQ